MTGNGGGDPGGTRVIALVLHYDGRDQAKEFQ